MVTGSDFQTSPQNPQEPETFGFRLSPQTTREEGLRLSFHLSRHFPNVVVIWEAGCFYAIAVIAEKMPSAKEWQSALTYIKMIWLKRAIAPSRADSSR